MMNTPWEVIKLLISYLSQSLLLLTKTRVLKTTSFTCNYVCEKFHQYCMGTEQKKLANLGVKNLVNLISTS